MRKIKNPWIEHKGYDCFACSPDNPIGLHMEFFEDGDDIISFWCPNERYQGWLDTMHGGILSTLIDETCGWVITRKLQTMGMTVHLDLHYKHPVKTDDPQLTIKAHITEQHHNIVSMKATLENSNAEVCVEADVAYYVMSPERAKEKGFTRCDVEDEQLFSM